MEQYSTNIKYQQIVASGKDLFWKYGIKRVSVEEICKESKVSKVTFYKFFTNKVELAKLILDEIVNKSLNNFQKLIDSDLSFTEKINKMLQLKLEGTKDISQEFMMDLYKNPALEIISYMEKQQEKSLKVTMDFILDSQKRGFLRKEIKVDFILHYFNHMMQMIYDKNLLLKYEKPQDLIMEATNFFFYGIGVKNNN